MTDPPPDGNFSGDTPGPGPAPRVAVRNPRGRAASRRDRTLADLAEQTEVGDVLIRSLTRAQLVLAVRIFAVFGCLLMGLPALFASHPDLGRYLVLGIPLPWVLLGGAIYPVLVIMGLLYVRQAERHEREFTDIVERG
ncbi:MAG: hypothetical protein ACRD0C_00130 [Acidimicrobiia bacterium]